MKQWTFQGLADDQHCHVEGRTLRNHDTFGPVDEAKLAPATARRLDGYVKAKLATVADVPDKPKAKKE